MTPELCRFPNIWIPSEVQCAFAAGVFNVWNRIHRTSVERYWGIAVGHFPHEPANCGADIGGGNAHCWLFRNRWKHLTLTMEGTRNEVASSRHLPWCPQSPLLGGELPRDLHPDQESGTAER